MRFDAGHRAACKPCMSLFYNAHPAPECDSVVLQLGQDLRRLGRGGVLRFQFTHNYDAYLLALQDAEGRAPSQKFQAALEACGL